MDKNGAACAGRRRKVCDSHHMHGQGLRESVPPGPNPWPTSGSGLHFPVQERGVVEAVRLHNSTSEMLASLPCSARCRDSAKEEFAKAARHCSLRNARDPHKLFEMGESKKKGNEFSLSSLPFLIFTIFVYAREISINMIYRG